MNYKIGLDIGIASVGWATLLLNSEDEPCKILDMGSRIFDVAENPKNGDSLASPRRENRSARRRLRRKRHRLERIKNLISSSGIMTLDEIYNIYSSAEEKSDIYEIRYNALDKLLKKEEFVGLLIHLAKRRGFKSNRKVEGEDTKSEAGKLTTAVKENTELLEKAGYRTIGEMLYKDEKFQKCKRNKSESYTNTFSRQMFCDEIAIIFDMQRKLGNTYATERLEEKYIDIYTSQRAFDEGPGGNSPYGGNQIEKMIGKCRFEEGEYRALKAQYSSEYSSLLQKINSIRMVSPNEKMQLSQEQRKQVINLFMKKDTVTYSAIRKELGINDSFIFNITYGEKSIDEIEKSTKLKFMQAYNKIKKAYGDGFKYLTKDKLNAIGYALTVHKNDEKIEAYLKVSDFSESEIAVALTLPAFKKAGNLSVKACEKITPFLEQGMLYNEACEAAGYNFKADDGQVKKRLLPAEADELKDICNPVVRRAISQTIKVINSIIRKYDESPSFISVELARELAKNFEDRGEIEKKQNENFGNNQKLMDMIREDYGKYNATGMDLVKLKLWREQDGICPYSLRPIEAERLFEIGYVDIDHIIPYSLCFDDGYKNKVLVFSNENRQKGNRLPMQYVKNKDAFTVWVENNIRNTGKRKNLLKESFTEDDEAAWKQRNLNDTEYISRFMYSYIRDHLEFAPNNTDRKKVITTVNGNATSYVRKRWGISKLREDGDLHHAVDALVVACITNGMIKKIAEYSKRHETHNAQLPDYDTLDKKTGELINRFPMPYPHFRDELEVRTSNVPNSLLEHKPLDNYSHDEKVEPIFVSRMPRRKASGPAHMETIRSAKAIDEGYKISRVSLTSLKLNSDGEIDGYFKPESNRRLYEALKARLNAFGGKGAEAFKDEFYKPTDSGKQAPLVKKVKVIDKTTLSVPVHGNTGIADNGSMVRIDVFNVENEGYYFIPIYVADTVKKELPNRAVVAGKPYSEWKEMDDRNFVFSLYPNDLIKVKHKKEMKFALVNKGSSKEKSYVTHEEFVYYKGANISTASIKTINHDDTYTINGMGVKSLDSIEKYQVGILGDKVKVNKEIRQVFNRKA